MPPYLSFTSILLHFKTSKFSIFKIIKLKYFLHFKALNYLFKFKFVNTTPNYSCSILSYYKQTDFATICSYIMLNFVIFFILVQKLVPLTQM